MRALVLLNLPLLATLAQLLLGCASAGPARDRQADPLRAKAGSVTVLVFGATDCPIANAYAPELESIHRCCSERGVAMWYVHPTNGLEREAAESHQREYGMTIPVLLDPGHRLVRAVGATVTPESAVLRFTADDRWTLVYLGRIDDQYVGIGKRRVQASTHDLRDAIDAALAGGVPAEPRTTAFGCFIERQK